MDTGTDGAAVAAAVAARQSEISEALHGLDRQELRHESRLPGWDRLTIVCHLRYGATASLRMTEDALGGKPSAFYPLGRDLQRSATLQPDDGELPADVVASFDEESRRLDNLWQGIDEGQWCLVVDEPEDNKDLGLITLRSLAVLRLTEVEAHGNDLDLDLSSWSSTFVSAALPMRLHWLTSRRSNHRPTDRAIDGSWALISTDGPSFLIDVHGNTVDVQENATDPGAGATICGTGSQLLAFILGRAPLSNLQVRGDQNLAESFLAAFPAP